MLGSRAKIGGEVLLEGRNLAGAPVAELKRVRGRRIAMIFQDPSSSLNPVHRIDANLGESLRLHRGLDGAAAEAEAQQLLDRVGIADAKRRPGRLSARAVEERHEPARDDRHGAGRPARSLLVADEPTTALDATVQAQILELLGEIRRDSGMALVLISHDLGVVAENTDRVCVMYAGRVVEDAPIDTVFEAPAHPYTRGLLAALPELDGPRRALTPIAGVVPEPANLPKWLGQLQRRAAIVASRRVKRHRRCRRCARPITGWPASAHDGVARSLRTCRASTRSGAACAWPFAKHANLQAVDGVSFNLPAGRTLGLVGEIRAAARPRPPSWCWALCRRAAARSGSTAARCCRRRTRWHGADCGAACRWSIRTRWAPLDRRLSVGRQVMEPLAIHGLGSSTAERREKASAMLDAVGLAQHHFDRFPHELSGGQRQRIVLARALMLDPQLLVCDEPISALDVSIQAQVVNLLLALQQKLGLAYLFISHDLRMVRQVSHEVAVMYLGRIVEQGDPDRLFAAPAHPYTQALVSAIPTHTRSKKRRIVLPGGAAQSGRPAPAGCAFHPRCPHAIERALPDRDAATAHPGRWPARGLSPRRAGRLMLRYLAGRLLRAILTIFLVITFAFFVLHLSGDPAMMILSADAPPEAIKAFRAAWGLDRPLWVQYAAYIWNALHGDLGNSMRDGRPAIQLVLERVPATLAITVPAFVLKLVIGIPAGIYAALHRNSLADRLTMMVSVAGFTVPSFVLALVLVLIFSVQLGWLPSAGSDKPASAILPIVTLGIAGAAILARFTRSAMLEVLGQPYIRASVGQGLALAQGRGGACTAQRGDPDHHNRRRLHGRHPDRGCRGGRERVRLAWHRPAAGVGGVEPRPRRRAGDPAAGRRNHGDGQYRRRCRLRLARSAPAQRKPCALRGALSASSRPGRRSPCWHSPGLP